MMQFKKKIRNFTVKYEPGEKQVVIYNISKDTSTKNYPQKKSTISRLKIFKEK
jgi:hypothetical protein